MSEKESNVSQMLEQYMDQSNETGEVEYTAYKKCVDETECGCCTKLCCLSMCC